MVCFFVRFLLECVGVLEVLEILLECHADYYQGSNCFLVVDFWRNLSNESAFSHLDGAATGLKTVQQSIFIL
jgi:hypothetical protein